MANGLSETGFLRKRLGDILADKNAAVTDVFGPDINLTPQSPDGQINGTLAESDADLWELAEAVYNAFNPSAATGNTLSALVQLNGITRASATSSSVSLDLTGTDTTVIPAGSLVSTASGLQYATDAEATITAGVAVVGGTAVVAGATVSLTGTVTTIVNPIAGWATVNNSSDATVGTAEETASALRIRRAQSVAFASQSLLESIFSAVANLEGIVQTIVLENDTNVTDGNGQPAHSVQVLVDGGDDTEIAEAIFNEKCVGISTIGSTNVAVVDNVGISHTINFQRPTLVQINVIVNLTTDASYPGNGDALITQAIIEYAEGLLIEGQRQGIGDDVINSRLYTPVNSVGGHTVDSLLISLNPAVPVSSANLVIAFDGLAQFLGGNITINS